MYALQLRNVVNADQPGSCQPSLTHLDQNITSAGNNDGIRDPNECIYRVLYAFFFFFLFDIIHNRMRSFLRSVPPHKSLDQFLGF